MTWFILRTAPQNEQRAYRWLTEGLAYGKRLVLNAYLPKEIKEIRVNQRSKAKRTVERPQYPGYLFIELDETEAQWRVIESTPGVVDFLSLDGETKATCSDAVIQLLRDKEAEVNAPKVTEWRFKPGDIVKLVDNSVPNATFLLKSLSKSDWAILELVSPGSVTTFRVRAQRLETASEAGQAAGGGAQRVAR